MNLGNLKTLARAYIPGAKTSVITDTVLQLIINNGVHDIAAYTACLKTNKKFNVVADQWEYNLSTVIGDFLVMDKPGLWWNAGTASSPDWIPLNPYTMKGMDNDRPAWRNGDSDSPQDYSIDGDILTVITAPDTALTDGFWLYYGKRPVSMTADSHYPFSGSDTELTHLMIFDEAILAWARWRINPIINKDETQGYIDITEQAYLRERERQFNIFKARPDIAHQQGLKMTFK